MTERTPPNDDTATATGSGTPDAGGGSPRRGPLDPSPQEEAAAAFVERARAHFRSARAQERRARAETFLSTGGFRARIPADREVLRRSEPAAEVFDVVLSQRPAPEDLVDQVADAFRRMEKNTGAPVLRRSGRRPPLVLDLTEEEVVAVLEEIYRRLAEESVSWLSPKGVPVDMRHAEEDSMMKRCNEIGFRIHRGELGPQEGTVAVLGVVLDLTDPDRTWGRDWRVTRRKPREKRGPRKPKLVEELKALWREKGMTHLAASRRLGISLDSEKGHYRRAKIGRKTT